MSYATEADLLVRIGKVNAGLYRGTGDTIDSAAAQADLDAASAEIDTYIGCRYRLPVVQAHALALLKIWTLTLAEELAWSRSGKIEIPKGVAARVEYIRKQLAAIAEGKLQLPGAEEKSASDGGAKLSIAAGAEPVFTRDKMGGF